MKSVIEEPQVRSLRPPLPAVSRGRGPSNGRWTGVALLLLTSIPVPSAARTAASAEASTRASAGGRDGVSGPVSRVDVSEAGGSQGKPDPGPELARRHQEWLEAADPLISAAERRVFLALTRDYQRDAFIDRFWRVRDPFPETARNELKDRWQRWLAVVPGLYGTFEDARARILIVHDKPTAASQVLCTKNRIPAEIWYYAGSAMVDFDFVVIFLSPRGVGPAHVYRPSGGGQGDPALAKARSCLGGHRLVEALHYIERLGSEYDRRLARVLAKPQPRSQEWLATFTAASTDLDEEAPRFEAEVTFQFPGRRDSRTVVQGVLAVNPEEVGVGEFAGYRSVDFLLVGEVVLDLQLFESFRYKFGFPADDLPGWRIPLAFQRYLRPGDYTVILKLEDLNSESFFRRELALAVPSVDMVLPPPPPSDPETARIFAEATAAVARGETAIRIVPPRGALQTGMVRIDTLALGDEIERVGFFLDDRLVMTKTRPPFNVELDLGDFPLLHPVRVEAYDSSGSVVARDEQLLNAGGNRFILRLVEPRAGRAYRTSLQAEADVQAPEDREVERVEFFLNEALVATLYQPPFVQPIALGERAGVTFVRAVAYLPDGSSTEDVVFIDAPEYLEEIDVQTVELYTTVLDRQGRPVEGLGEERFRVFEDGAEQRIARFDQVRNLPIHAAVLIDNSASMQGSLEEVRKAALRFFRQAITAKDQAAVITFNKYPHLAVNLTNRLEALGGGLAGLTAEGETALYDSLIFALYYLAGVEGQRALLVLSDGRDEGSRFSFEEALEYARRAGVTVFTLSLDGGAHARLAPVAEETGGRAFFIRDTAELAAVYDSIQRELRSQYLIVYQSSNTGDSTAFRRVELEVDHPGSRARTISGYYP